MLNMMKTYAEYYVGPYVKNEEGQGMAEYGLLLALIAVVAIAGVVLLGPAIKNMFTNVSGQIK